MQPAGRRNYNTCSYLHPTTQHTLATGIGQDVQDRRHALKGTKPATAPSSARVRRTRGLTTGFSGCACGCGLRLGRLRMWCEQRLRRPRSDGRAVSSDGRCSGEQAASAREIPPPATATYLLTASGSSLMGVWPRLVAVASSR
jgi:hypothetical protein